jgi:hypothetical protein
MISARRKEELKEADLNEVLEVEEQISGLKTVTERELCFKYD